jgi:hypothetical protein
MHPSRSDIDTAERLSRRRARILPALAGVFLVQQVIFLAGTPQLDSARTVDLVKVAAWIVLTLVLLFSLWRGGFWFQSRPVRHLLDDDVSRAHRADATSLGFLFAILAAVTLYVLSMVDLMAVREALHLVVSAGIVAALARFGFLERRAHRVG